MTRLIRDPSEFNVASFNARHQLDAYPVGGNVHLFTAARHPDLYVVPSDTRFNTLANTVNDLVVYLSSLPGGTSGPVALSPQPGEPSARMPGGPYAVEVVETLQPPYFDVIPSEDCYLGGVQYLTPPTVTGLSRTLQVYDAETQQLIGQYGGAPDENGRMLTNGSVKLLANQRYRIGVEPIASERTRMQYRVDDGSITSMYQFAIGSTAYTRDLYAPTNLFPSTVMFNEGLPYGLILMEGQKPKGVVGPLDPADLPGFPAASAGMEPYRRHDDQLGWRYTPGLLARSIDEQGASSASVQLRPGSPQWGQNFSDAATVGGYSMDEGEEHQGMMVVQRFRLTEEVTARILRLEFWNYWDASNPELATGVNGLQIVLLNESGVIADTASISVAETAVGIEGASDRTTYRVYADIFLNGPPLVPGELYTLLISARQANVWLDLPYAAADETVARGIVPEELLARYPEQAGDRVAASHDSDELLTGSLLFEVGTNLPRPAQQVLTAPLNLKAQTSAPVYSHAAGRLLFPSGGPGSRHLESASGYEAVARYPEGYHPAIPSVMGDIRKPFVSDVAPAPMVTVPNGGTFTGDQPTMQFVALHLAHPGGVPLNGVRLSQEALAAVQDALDDRGADFAIKMELYDTTFAARDDLDTVWRFENASVLLPLDGVNHFVWKRASALVADPVLTVPQAPWMRRDRTYLILLYAVPVYWYDAPYTRDAAFPIWPTLGVGVSAGNDEVDAQVRTVWADLDGGFLPDYLRFARGIPSGVEVLVGGGKRDVLGESGGTQAGATQEQVDAAVTQAQVDAAVTQAKVDASVTPERLGAALTPERLDAAVTQAKVTAAVTQAKVDSAVRTALLPRTLVVEGLPYALPSAQPLDMPAVDAWNFIARATVASPQLSLPDPGVAYPLPITVNNHSSTYFRFGITEPVYSPDSAASLDSGEGRALRQRLGLSADPYAQELVLEWQAPFSNIVSNFAPVSTYRVRLLGDGDAVLREWNVTPGQIGAVPRTFTRLPIESLGALPLSATVEIVPTSLGARRAYDGYNGYYDPNYYPIVYVGVPGVNMSTYQATLDGVGVTHAGNPQDPVEYPTRLAGVVLQRTTVAIPTPTATVVDGAQVLTGPGGVFVPGLPSVERTTRTARRLIAIIRPTPWQLQMPGGFALRFVHSDLENAIYGGVVLTLKRPAGSATYGPGWAGTTRLRIEAELAWDNSAGAYVVRSKVYDADTGALLRSDTGRTVYTALSAQVLDVPRYTLSHGMDNGGLKLATPMDTLAIERWTEWSQ